MRKSGLISAAGGPQAHCVSMDVAVPGALAQAVTAIDHPHLFALVNCAGVMYPEPILDADPARWRALFDINVLATLEASQAAVRRMRAGGGPGHILNFSSLTARWDAGGVYGATKIAVEMIGRTLRKELERDPIRVTTIVPGGFVTQLGRGFTEDMQVALGNIIQDRNLPMDQMMGDPDHLASMVSYILNQLTDINIGEVVIRPPVSVEY